MALITDFKHSAQIPASKLLPLVSAETKYESIQTRAQVDCGNKDLAPWQPCLLGICNPTLPL
jgi:hypothetical protein